MIKVDVPKTPAQVWRELDTHDKAFGVGLALRVIWELAKPVLLWSALILAMGVWAVTYAVFRALFRSQ